MHCVVCTGLFSNAVLALDHSDYEPVVYIDQEPNHHMVLKNSSFRVFDVVFPPGKISLFHLHDKDSVLLCLDGADVPSEEPGKKAVPRPPIQSGQIYYREYATHPFIHRIRNISQTHFRILDIEIMKERSTQNTALPALSVAFSMVIDNDRVRVSKTEIKPGETTDSLSFQGPHLLVAMNKGLYSIESSERGKINIDAERGHLLWSEERRKGPIQNLGKYSLELVIIEVK